MQQDLFVTATEVLKNLLPKDGVVEVCPAFFKENESEILVDYLMHEIEWQQDSMKLYGKQVNLPRLTAWYGANNKKYSFSGIDMNPKPWTKELLFIKDRVEKQSGFKFTSVLLNYYRNGNDSVSWHQDNEKVLRVNPVIVSVSFGATRTFKFRHVDDHRLVRSVELTNGMYVLMNGETQHKWEHTIPKTSRPVKERISLTFRILF
ncbi:MAG: alpha-ketoglutarate-dependent dioxygenase AlkB [Bacteroidia bacterium]